jgi:cellulose synthase/poly-beta-1,6-N-acetylglucosamine synthase-like glycosyltransferase
MDLSVVVPTYRRPAELRHCLEGLAAQKRLPGEVLVMARGDDAQTWEVLSDAPAALSVRGVRVDAAGVVVALNAALNAAAGDLVAITDDDAVARPDWLERVERYLRADARLGGVGGRDVVHDASGSGVGTEPVVGVIRRYGRVIGNHHLGTGGGRRVELLKGVNMAFRREALRGLRIDERLRGLGAQPHWEIDLCLRVISAGWELLYDPAIVVDHYPAQRFDEDQRMGRPLQALQNEVYNEMYALLRNLPRWRGAIAFGYGMAVGTRLAPGIVTALERRLRGERVALRLAAAQRARLEALGDLIRRAA